MPLSWGDRPTRIPLAGRQRLLVLAVVGVLLGGGSAAIVYGLTKPPALAALVVKDGSITDVLEGDFANYNSAYGFVRYFNATTYANQSSGPTSTLTLRLFTATYAFAGVVHTDMYAAVQGEFASNLNLTGLTLAYNETGTIWGFYAGPQLDPTNISQYPPDWMTNFTYTNITWPGSTNVTYNGPPITSAAATGSAALTPALVNETRKGPVYEFAFSAWLWAEYPLVSNGFLGFRATVTGRFTPDVSVGILLQVLDVP